MNEIFQAIINEHRLIIKTQTNQTNKGKFLFFKNILMRNLYKFDVKSNFGL